MFRFSPLLATGRIAWTQQTLSCSYLFGRASEITSLFRSIEKPLDGNARSIVLLCGLHLVVQLRIKTVVNGAQNVVRPWVRMSDSADNPVKTLNFNVGVLGHVDSGKTSLARALSSTASTAAFDKNPQSRERGITLDLGFSSFTVDLPDHLRDSGGQKQYDSLQFTLVDCPGHASLIRTIIGGELYIS